MTTATPAQQRRLLDLQALDTRLSQLVHRAKTLPEHAALVELDGRRRTLSDDLVQARTEQSDISRELTKAEADVAQVRSRAERDQARLDSGEGSAKALEGLQHEIASLARRQAALEDVELEVMERMEGATTRVDVLTADLARLDAERTALTDAITAQTAELDAETTRVQAERDRIASDVDDELLALYDRIRGSSGGLAAAELVGRRCGGCRLELNAVEMGRLKNTGPDEVMRCEECERILIRTPASAV